VLFNSKIFVAFIAIVLSVYYWLPDRAKIWFLLALSYFFYGFWDPRLLSLIVLSTLVDFTCGQRVFDHLQADNRPAAKRWLWLSLATNLGILGFFKYYDFFVGELVFAANLLGAGLDADRYLLHLLLPVGISFYTFQTLSYSIDVYYGHLKPEPHFGKFALFVSFFPQLVAGPIERASRFLPQLQRETRWDYPRVVSGLKQMTWGFFKKVVIADRLSLYVDTVYSSPGDYQGLPLILATYFFAFQIYADFSGYSDIAIGAARVLGYDLMENFRRPYFARSISEFWKRWHISLSTWFRDYLYIPLGGNRVGRLRWYLNLFTVFVVSGAWHGANWTFMVWGALHGGYLVAAILTEGLRERIGKTVTVAGRPVFGRWWEVFVVFHLSLLAWIFFRAASVSDAFLVMERSWIDLGTQLSAVMSLDARYLDALLVGGVGVSRFDFVASLLLVVFLYAAELVIEQGWHETKLGKRPVARMIWYDLLVMACLLLGVFGQTQFIYFQF
jgi:alginate O-acetyltransferase complex protein AlgI